MPESLAAIANRRYGTSRDGFLRKPQAFITEYERLFAGLRQQPVSLLELGVHTGQSLLTWRDYFPHGVIVGIDIDPAPESIAGSAGIHFVRGSQDDPSILDAAGSVSRQGFDFIIDDASHMGKLTRRSIGYLFPKWLKPGGIYIIEDVGAAFGTAPDGALFEEAHSEGPVFPSHHHSILGVVKQLVDQTVGIPDRPPPLDIERIAILPNLAVIKKAGPSLVSSRSD